MLHARRSAPAAILLAGALLLGACSSDDAGGQADGTDAPTEAATDTATDAPAPAGTEAPTDAAPLVSEDLPDGVAATVADEEIPVASLEERFQLVSQLPDVASQLEGADGESITAQVNSTILSQLVLQSIVLQGAEDEGVEITEEDVAAEREAVTEQAGGQDALAQQLSEAGLPEGQLERELRASVAFQKVTEVLLDASDQDVQYDPDAATPDPAVQQVQQEWLLGLVSSTDVVVDQEYGGWDQAAGQVVPA